MRKYFLLTLYNLRKWIFVAFFCLYGVKIFPQESDHNHGSQKNIPNLIYYDADDININKSTGSLVLTGHATFLIGNVYISSEKVILQKSEGLVVCEGNVQLIYSKEKATASKIILDLVTQQVRMDNAVIFSDPNGNDEKDTEEVLGLTRAEIAFNRAKDLRSQEIEQQLKELRENYVNLKNLKTLKKDTSLDLEISNVLRLYSQLLARYTRTQYQPNFYLSEIPEDKRQKFIERRKAVEKFNQDNPKLVNQITNFTPIPGYIKLSANQVIQKDQKTFLLKDASITPCHCSSFGEPTLYGFSSQNAQIDIGEYVTLQGATVDVFSIPVFYLPWMKLPIKNKRSTGFLYPGGYVSSNAGQAISVPFFLTLGDHADSTITYENFSQRGSRFSGEFRARLLEDSQIYMSGQYIGDRLYHDDWMNNSSLIDQSISSTTNQNQQQVFESYRGNDHAQRWYTESSFNLPISHFASVKTNGQFVSDNNYLYDFSTSANVNPTAAVFGNTTSSSRRFLVQEADGEYYGDNFILSLRAQGLQDLFSTSQSHTPQRMPKIEFTLLPDHYADLPFVLSNHSTWEKITRFGGSNFIAVPAQTSAPSSTTPLSNPSNNQKSPFDPYIQGNRLYTDTTIEFPMPTNPYVNASVSTQMTAVQYDFPAAAPYGELQPHQAYLTHSAHLDVPLYGRYDFDNKNTENSDSLVQNFTPFVQFDYIPGVARDSDYPNTYQLWYAQDNVASSAYLKVGANTAWTIKRGKYKNSNQTIPRLLGLPEPGVANLDYFSQAIEEKKFNIKTNPKEIFDFSSEKESLEIYNSWAEHELDHYYNLVLADELDQNYVWPQGNYYELASDLEITPISISVSTNYNFLAQKTADELNSRAGPNFNSPYPVTPYGDIVGNISWNLSPFVPLNGAFDASYSTVYKRINMINVSTGASLLYGFAASYAHSLQYVVSPTNPSLFVLRTQRTTSITYTPKHWLQFGFQWAKATDETTPASTDMTQGRDYASSYNISFINLQDCLDLIVSRNKPAGLSEGQATYALGLNLKIFGYSTGFPQIGDYLNRSLQK